MCELKYEFWIHASVELQIGIDFRCLKKKKSPVILFKLIIIPTVRTNVTHDTQHKGNLCVSQTAWFIVHIDQVYFCHYLYQKNPDSASKLMFLTFFFQAALLISDKSNRFQVSNEIHRNYFMWDDFVWFAEELVRNLVSCVTFVDTWPYVLCAVPCPGPMLTSVHTCDNLLYNLLHTCFLTWL